MNLHSTESTFRLPLPDTALPLTAPLIRPLDIPLSLGRVYTAGLDAQGRPVAGDDDAVWVRVTPGGHWRAVGSGHAVTCRGCGQAWLACQLDALRCARPATAQDVASALLARTKASA